MSDALSSKMAYLCRFLLVVTKNQRYVRWYAFSCRLLPPDKARKGLEPLGEDPDTPRAQRLTLYDR